LLVHQNPYDVIRPTGDFPFNAYFKYPLPAAVVAIPFAWMPADVAAAAFGGVSTALLAYGISEDGFDRLIILLSTPYLTTLYTGQWSTLLMAGALLPAFSWVAACKPTVGIATFFARPNWYAVVGGVVLVAISFLLCPSWVGDWLNALRRGDLESWYKAPVTLIGGQLLLLGLLRWRRPEARFLVGVSIMPQILGYYTGFLPMLVAKTRREALVLSVSALTGSTLSGLYYGSRESGDLGPALWGYWLLGFIFLPALVIVLRRPNVGDGKMVAS
jgi:hypothetical protein